MRRRRFIEICAITGIASSLHSSLWSKTIGLEKVTWKGYLLGAEGSITLYTDKKKQTQEILSNCFKRIQSLESNFSLYQENSELSKLNQNGILRNPNTDWLQLFSSIEKSNTITSGYFDPTVQVIWNQFQNKNFSSSKEFHKLKNLIGWEKVEWNDAVIRLSHPKMKLTLNGIAQGYITDQISNTLKENGYSNVLVQLGETRAIGNHPRGRPWKLLIPSTTSEKKPSTVELTNQSISTSSGSGTIIDIHRNHLINPLNGTSPNPKKQISVIAPTATEADALSTALCIAPDRILNQVKNNYKIIVTI